MTTRDATPHDSRFATTHWSIIASARSSDTPGARAAMEVLCRTYWFPLYTFVCGRGYSRDDAQDLTQQFFTRLLETDWMSRADCQKGKFRSFLLVSIKHFLSDEWDKSRALKRGGGVPDLSLQFDTGEGSCLREPISCGTPEESFERCWAITLLEGVVEQLEREYAQANKLVLYEALHPCLVGERTSQPYAKLAVDLGMSESAVKSAVNRLRKRYRELLRKEIRNTVASEDDVLEELRYLFQVLTRRQA